MTKTRFDITLIYTNGSYGVVQNCALDYLNECIAQGSISVNKYRVRIDSVTTTTKETYTENLEN